MHVALKHSLSSDTHFRKNTCTWQNSLGPVDHVQRTQLLTVSVIQVSHNHSEHTLTSLVHWPHTLLTQSDSALVCSDHAHCVQLLVGTSCPHTHDTYTLTLCTHSHTLLRISTVSYTLTHCVTAQYSTHPQHCVQLTGHSTSVHKHCVHTHSPFSVQLRRTWRQMWLQQLQSTSCSPLNHWTTAVLCYGSSSLLISRSARICVPVSGRGHRVDLTLCTASVSTAVVETCSSEQLCGE